MGRERTRTGALCPWGGAVVQRGELTVELERVAGGIYDALARAMYASPSRRKLSDGLAAWCPHEGGTFRLWGK